MKTDAPQRKVYYADAHALAFPLGGIGTGNVSLNARGSLIDWEIYNRPGKGNLLPNSFFALRVQYGDEAPVLRVVEGQIASPHTTATGYHPTTGAGLPRFENVNFRAEYPLAQLVFEDSALSVNVGLEAYTPFVPLNPEDSGIPCAILKYTVENRATASANITLVGSLMNPVGGLTRDPWLNPDPNRFGASVNTFREQDGFRGLSMTVAELAATDLEFGSVGLFTNHPDVTVKPHWRRGAWFDFLREFWDDLSTDGRLTDLGYTSLDANWMPDTGSLGVVDKLAPGEVKTYTFVLTWYFPNRPASWFYTPGRVTRNHYTTCFTDAEDVARYVFENLPRLDEATHLFHDALFNTTLPSYVVEAIASNLVPMRSNTCFWLEDGRFYGWEGCFDDAGSCPGTCTHVWSYAQSIAALFPSLERAMREVEFLVETDDDGYMAFRTYKPFGERVLLPSGERREPAVDGQMGSVLRVYREWLYSGDREWLESLWASVAKSLRFAAAYWDSDRDDVLDGKQHNTYDIEFYGPNPLTALYYLAALRAGEALANVLGDTTMADYCRDIFERSSRKFDSIAWNGEYYVQVLDDVDAHPYQHGAGCLSDQLMGQWHARLLNLGDLLPRERIRQAVYSIYRYNFHENFREHTNVQRTFVLNDEAGLVLCSWPLGGRPRFPFVYSDEVWTGVEYYVAALLIYEGWLDEGLRLVKAIRDRHDGYRRNPLNEVECGHHYARSMSSWAVMLALTGFHCDVSRGEVSFEPVLAASTEADEFRSIWASGTAWGTYAQRLNPQTNAWDVEIKVLGGDASDLTFYANHLPVGGLVRSISPTLE